MNMNHYFPDWSSTMGDTFAPLSGEDDGLIELMWCDGHVVMQSQQAPRKPSTRPDKADDDAAAAAQQAWFQYPVEEDPLERDDLFSELFGEAQAVVDGTARGPCCKEKAAELRGGDEAARQSSSRMMPPPPRPAHAHAPREEKASCPGDGATATRKSAGGCEATATGTGTATEGGESSSMLTNGSSFCGSNHVQTPPPPPPPRARDAVAMPGGAKDVAARARDAATVTSSATRSRSCTTRSEQQPGPGAAAAAANAHRSSKRKQSDATDTEDVEFESADVMCEPAHKTTTAKRRRAAEVHNLSERRRRDRINEKMKALQELIPHCNKTDKASMLDEAIEYLKSLQLQLQMMWMGGGMAAAAAAPVVFPAGVHQYMQRMMAGNPPHVSSMPGMPFMAPPPAVQGPTLPDPYAARYLAVDHHLAPPPMVAPPPPYTAAMGFYQRQNPALLPLPPPQPPTVPAASPSPSDGILHRKYENCGKPEIQGMTG